MWVEFVRVMESPIGRLCLRSNGKGVTALQFGGWELRRDELPLLVQAERELTEYFAGRRRDFSVPLCMHGTDFQKAVWQALMEIPYGETASYREIAEKIGNPKSCRAVGMANNRNPLPIFIPCHRVVGADGKLVGYAGGLRMKQFLLELEGKYV